MPPNLEIQADELRAELVTAMGLDPASQSLTFNPRILAFAQNVRAEALAEIALAEINDVGVLVPEGLTQRETRVFCAGVAGARARFVALIDASIDTQSGAANGET